MLEGDRSNFRLSGPWYHQPDERSIAAAKERVNTFARVADIVDTNSVIKKLDSRVTKHILAEQELNDAQQALLMAEGGLGVVFDETGISDRIRQAVSDRRRVVLETNAQLGPFSLNAAHPLE